MPDDQDDNIVQPLAEDNDTPFSAPADPIDDPISSLPVLDPTHPVTDTDIDPTEAYHENLSGAAEASEPNAGNAVTGYEPEENSSEQGV